MKHIYSKDLLEDRIHLINAKNQQKKNKSFNPRFSTIQSEETCFSINSNKGNDYLKIKRIDNPINFSNEKTTLNVDSFLKQDSRKIRRIILTPFPKKEQIKKIKDNNSIIKKYKKISMSNKYLKLPSFSFIKNMNKSNKMLLNSFNKHNFQSRNVNESIKNREIKNLTEITNSYTPNKNYLKTIKQNEENEKEDDITKTLLSEFNFRKRKNDKIITINKLQKTKLDSFNPKLCFPSIINDTNIMFEMYCKNINYERNKLRVHLKRKKKI